MQNRLRHGGLGGIPTLLKSSGGWSSYWRKRLDTWLNKSSDDELTDSISELNAKLIPSYFDSTDKISAPVPYTRFIDTDHELDVLDDSITIAVKCNPVAKNTYQGIAGKLIAGTVVGRYGINVSVTNEILASFQTTNGVFSIDSPTVVDGLWHHNALVIDRLTSKAYLYIDGILVNTGGTSFTGTFPEVSTDYKFRLGSFNKLDGVGSYICGCGYSDLVFYKKALTQSEITQLAGGTIVDGYYSYWPLNYNKEWLYDVSSHGCHIKIEVDRSDLYDYGDNGSKYLQENGFSLWESGANSKYYIPYKDDGTPISLTAGTDIPSLYEKTKDNPYPYSLYLSRCMIDFDPDETTDSKLDMFDRSNIVIYSDDARAGEYNASYPYQWALEEIYDHFILQGMTNADYKDRLFIKHSVDGRVEILNSPTVMTGSEKQKMMDYFNYGTGSPYHELDQLLSTTYLPTLRDNKVLAYDDGNEMSLSLDGGVTFPVTKDVTGDVSIITFAYIFKNGNILFATHDKVFLSKDNLSTYNEIIPTGIDGNAFTPTTYNNFFGLIWEGGLEIDGVEVLMWGNYSTEEGTEYTNINVWVTNDSGEHIKSIYKIGVTLVEGTSIPGRHVHAVNYINGKFIIQTGDTTASGENNWIECDYNVITNTATFKKLAGSSIVANDWYKTVGMELVNGYVYWGSDTTSDSKKYGVWRVPYDSLTDSAKYQKVYAQGVIVVTFKKAGGLFLCFPRCDEGGLDKKIVSSKDGLNWQVNKITVGSKLNDKWPQYQLPIEANSDGYVRVVPNRSSYLLVTTGEVVLIRKKTKWD